MVQVTGFSTLQKYAWTVRRAIYAASAMDVFKTCLQKAMQPLASRRQILRTIAPSKMLSVCQLWQSIQCLGRQVFHTLDAP